VQNGVPDASNVVGLDPLVVAQYDTSVRVFPWRGNPNFVGADIVAVELPVTLLGDYHITTGSPARNAGVSGAGGILAPNQDYDRQPRPSQARFEMGADETGAAYPNTPILFPTGAAMQAVGTVAPAIANLDYLIWLPLVMHNSTGIVPAWGGDTESFVFDEATGIEVVESGFVNWNSSLFGPDQEAYFTYLGASATATRQDLLLKVDELRFQDGVEQFLLIHHRPGAPVRSAPATVQLLPIDAAWLRGLAKRHWSSRSLPTFTMDWRELFSALIRQHLFVSLYRAFAESMASENASRLASMQAAEKNIQDHLSVLAVEYHQGRQQSITEELLDIVAGFETLTKEDDRRARKNAARSSR